MKTCSGLMGRIFGHKFEKFEFDYVKNRPSEDEPSIVIRNLAEKGVVLPDDFVITYLDQRILGMSYSEFSPDSAAEIAQAINKEYKIFLRILYDDRDNRGLKVDFNEIKESDINNYFNVLTGKTTNDFPEFRERFNLAYALSKAKENFSINKFDQNKTRAEIYEFNQETLERVVKEMDERRKKWLKQYKT
jgi:6-pyruvoyl-tetrahydropterin synthase